MENIVENKDSDNFELRKKAFLNQLIEEYDKRILEESFFSNKPTYQTTKAHGYPPYNDQLLKKTIVIKKNLLGPLFHIGILLTAITVCVLHYRREISQLLTIILLIAMALFIIKDLADRKPKIILTSKSLWIHQWKDSIKWEDIVASYIATKKDDETVIYELLIYYYDKQNDEFKSLTYQINNLSMSTEILSGIIEHWKKESFKV